MTVPTITPLPPAPSRNDGPANFTPMADALMAAQQRFVDETNAVAAFVDQRALDSDSRATDSATSAAAAQQALTDARLARDAAQSTANFKGQWSGLSGSLALPATVLHNQQIWSLLTNLANVAASEPGVTGDWLVMGGIDASKTADFTAARNGSYWLGTTLIATLPDTTTPPPKGTFVRFTKALGAEPTIQTGAGNAVIQTAKGADTALLFDLDAEIIFVFNGTDWEI